MRGATFTECEFSWLGDNGISQMGSVKFDRTGDAGEDCAPVAADVRLWESPNPQLGPEERKLIYFLNVVLILPFINIL